MATDILMHAAPDTSANLFHALPTDIGDPLTYLEVGGRRLAVVSVLDRDAVTALGVDVLDPQQLGRGELSAAGLPWHAVGAEIALRACRDVGLTAALVPPDFPILVADHLRAEGVELVVDEAMFAQRRRVKTPEQLEGIRRAQAAADAAMAVARELLHAARPGLTAGDVRRAMQEETHGLGSDLPESTIVSPGTQGARGHEAGHGPISPGEGVIVDIWPRDRSSRCWTDMTRTFVAGGTDATEPLATWWDLCRASLDLVYDAIRPGVGGGELHRRSCEPFEEAGEPTLHSHPADGPPLTEGYFHSLGHGVGLDVHEPPAMGRASDDLVAGDVIAIEPGCYRQGVGGCRLEDTVLVTADGVERLGSFPYDL